MGLLPFVIYPSSPNGQARPPVAWLWCYRILSCRYCESIAMELRFLESNIKVRDLPVGSTDKKIQEIDVNGIPSIQNKDIGIEKKAVDENPGMFLSDSSFSSAHWRGARKDGDGGEKERTSFDAERTDDSMVVDCSRDVGRNSIATSHAGTCAVDGSRGGRNGQSQSAGSLGKSMSSFCWWEACGGDIIAFAASSCQLAMESSSSSSSSLSTATSTNLINTTAFSDGYRNEYWAIYKTALESILEDWALSIIRTQNTYPYSLIINKEYFSLNNPSLLLKKRIGDNVTEISIQKPQVIHLLNLMPMCSICMVNGFFLNLHRYVYIDMQAFV